MKAEEASTRSEPIASLAAVLNRLRTEAGLTMYQLAQRSGVTRAQLSRMESGGARHPAPETMQRIARALNVDPEEFYDAAWQESDAPLPSPGVYFRSKYHLTDAQVEQLEASVRRITGKEDGTSAERNESKN